METLSDVGAFDEDDMEVEVEVEEEAMEVEVEHLQIVVEEDNTWTFATGHPAEVSHLRCFMTLFHLSF